MNRRQRSWLFTPGDNPRHLAKLSVDICDVSLIDLEDSVSPSRKAEARTQVERILSEDARSHPLWVRVNPLRSAWLNEDIACAIAANGICLPKIGSPDEINEVEILLEQHERRIGKPRGSTLLLVAIESPQGLIHAHEIATCNSRIMGLLFGAEDYALALGLPPSEPATLDALTYAQCQLVVAAKAAGIQVIAGVSTNITDLEGHRAHCVRARNLGFTGVAAIHPDQVTIIDEVFRPSADALENARSIVSAYASGLKGGKGVITHNGAMIDYPIAARAAHMLSEEGIGDPPDWLERVRQ